MLSMLETVMRTGMTGAVLDEVVEEDAMVVWACALLEEAWTAVLVVAAEQSESVGLLLLEVRQQEVSLRLARTCAQVVCLRTGLLHA